MTDLTPNSFEKVTRTISVPKCVCPFPQWRGTVPDTYGRKTVLRYRNKSLFAELVVLRFLQRQGWKGVWVDSYRRRNLVNMPWIGKPVILDGREGDFLNAIRKKLRCYGGCWDVFAWRGRRFRFTELKRSKKDKFRKNQIRWMKVALRSRLVTLKDFLIVEWTPAN